MTRRRVLWSLATLLVVAGAAPLLATYVWDSRSATLRRQLDRGAIAAPGVYSAADLKADELPPPVERFFLHVLRDGQPIVRAVDLVTDGEFQSGTGDAGWRSFTAQQRFSTSPPGFVWDAHIHMAPFMPVYVRDAYVGRHTEMRGRLLGLFPVVDDADTPELAAGQLVRYLAETIWFPTALLPQHNAVTWTPLDATSAVATMTERGLSIALRFRFTPGGDVEEVFSADRMRAVGDRYVPTPWAVRCADFQERNGIRIPIWCEAEWRLPEGPLPYWRGRVSAVRYELAR